MDENTKQCESEVRATLERYGLQMIVCQRLIDNQLIPLNAPLAIVFIPKPILGEPVTIQADELTNPTQQPIV